MVDFSTMSEEQLAEFLAQQSAEAEAKKNGSSPRTDKNGRPVIAPPTQADVDMNTSPIPNILRAAANTATFGATGNLERDVKANYRNLMDGDGSNMGFHEFEQQVKAEQQKRAADNPAQEAVGDILGVVAGAGTALPKMGLAGLKKYATVAGLGAAENLGAQSGKGNIDSIMDAAGAATLGGVLAPVGQAAGELVTPIADKAFRTFTRNPEVAEQAARRQIGQDLMSGGNIDADTISNRMSMPEGALPTIQGAADNLAPNQTIADMVPRARTELARGVDGSSPGALGPVRDLAEKRIDTMDDEAAALTQRYIRPNMTKGESAVDLDRRLASTRADYEAMANSSAFKNVKQADESRNINREAMNKKVVAAFGDDIGPDEKNVRDWVITQLSGGRGVDTMSPKNLLKVKKKIDEEVNLLMRGNTDSKVTTESLIALVKVKKKINQQLGKTLPDYKRLSSNYAYEFDLADMRETGADMFSKTKYDPKQLETYVASLDGEPIRQQAFVTGALQAMMKRSGTDSIAEVKRVMKPGNPDYDKLAAILPKGTLDAFVKDADALLARADTAKTVKSAADRVARSRPNEKGQNPALRLAAGVGSALQQRYGSAAYLASGTVQDPIHASMNRHITDLLSAEGPEAAAKLRSIMDEPAKKTKFRGSTAGRVAAAAQEPEYKRKRGRANRSIMD